MLDEFEMNEIETRKQIYRIILVSIGTVFLYFLIEKVRRFLPDYVLEWGEINIYTIGLIIIGIVIINSILIPTFLNQVQPSLSKMRVVVYTGIIISGIEIVFKLVQSFYFAYEIEFSKLFEAIIIFCSIGMLIANIRIHKIRTENALIPILLLIGFWIILGMTI